MATAFKEDFPEAEKVARTYRRSETYLNESAEEPQRLTNLYFAEAEILDIFDFNLISGDGTQALSQPGNILLSSSAAERLFGQESPIGKEVLFESNTPLQVAGLFEDLPATTHLPAQAWFPLAH